MTTNEQIETAAILQMRKDLDEARELLLIGIEAFNAMTAAAWRYGVNPERSVNAADKTRAFLARTDATTNR
jgi:hypothetical protein